MFRKFIILQGHIEIKVSVFQPDSKPTFWGIFHMLIDENEALQCKLNCKEDGTTWAKVEGRIEGACEVFFKYM